MDKTEVEFEPMVRFWDNGGAEIENCSLYKANDVLKRFNGSFPADVTIEVYYKEDLKVYHIAVEQQDDDMINVIEKKLKVPDHNFIPYLKNHCLLSVLEEKAMDQGAGSEKLYWDSIKDYVLRARIAINKDYNSLSQVEIPMKENYLQAAEQEVEENYNMIDGVINNIPNMRSDKSILERIKYYQKLIDSKEKEKVKETEKMYTV